MQTLQQLRAGDLHGVTHLKLVEGLTEFPLDILSLADSLEYLDLSNNQLSTLPEAFAELHKLKIVFLSHNRFTVLPRVLGRCKALEVVGFKTNQISTVPADALPPKIRWLILTDNRIAHLPDTLGDCVFLRKLMLAGNALTALPTRIAGCQQLQLLRISANKLTTFPDVLLQLPQLAWLAFAGNPFSNTQKQHIAVPQMAREQLRLGEVLGQGASGVIYRARCMVPTLPAIVAVKIFKGDVTSDGFPQDELAACLALKPHPNLVSPLAYVADAEGRALVMALIPEDYVNLGLPPSLASCTRDTFAEGFNLSLATIKRLFNQMQAVVAALHEQGFCHGDIYAHNVLYKKSVLYKRSVLAKKAALNKEDDTDAHLLFGDLGAASDISGLPAAQRAALIRIERRALGHFLADLLSVHAATPNDDALLLQALQKQATDLTISSAV